METWINQSCPHCKAKNWLNLGDLEDLTVADIDTCKCWQCEKKFVLEGFEDFEEGNCEWGRKNPEDPWKWCEN